jgi:hypothetical protein
MTEATHSDKYEYSDPQPWVQKSETQDNQRQILPVDDMTGKVGKPLADSAGSVGS